MPLSPLRQQFQAPGPQIPGQAVLGALGGGQLPAPGAVPGPTPSPLGAMPEQPNPQHEALRRMLGQGGY